VTHLGFLRKELNGLSYFQMTNCHARNVFFFCENCKEESKLLRYSPVSLSLHTKQHKKYVVLIYIVHFNYRLHHAARNFGEYLMTSHCYLSLTHSFG
jgi:hypothetical protein